MGARRWCEDGAAVEGEGESGDEWADGAEAEAEGWVAEGGLVGLRLLSCLCVWRSHSCCAVAARCSWDLRVEIILLLLLKLHVCKREQRKGTE